MIAKSLKVHNGSARVAHSCEKFRQICMDILTSTTSRIGSQATSAKVVEIVNQAIERFCGKVERQEARSKRQEARSKRQEAEIKSS